MNRIADLGFPGNGRIGKLYDLETRTSISVRSRTTTTRMKGRRAIAGPNFSTELATTARSKWHFLRSGNRATQIALVRYYSAFFQDQLETPQIGDVLKRLGPDHNQAASLTNSTMPS